MKKQLAFWLIIFSSCMILQSSDSAIAATGNQGYAIYRDGVFFGANWHAGLMDEPTTSHSLPVLHHPGSGEFVKWDSYANFLNGKNFKGVYRPNGTVSSSSRDLFVAMGRNLRTENIKYSLLYQVNYPDFEVGEWVTYDEITAMRCDGVVEYVYEWYSFRVYGSNSYWDVTKASIFNKDEHKGATPSPKTQVDYLTLVQTTAP